MKRMCIGICVCVMLVASSYAKDVEDLGAKVAVAYVTAVIGGEVKKADAMVALPYSMDRSETCLKLENIHAFHQKVLKDEGKRPMPKYAVKLTDKFKPLKKDVFKVPYKVYRIDILDGDDKGESIDIYVIKDGTTYKVIGFSD